MSKSPWKLKIEEIAKRDRMENEDTNDWKDLDIKVSIEVLKNMKKYDIQFKGFDGDWKDSEIADTQVMFVKIIDDNLKYRYRLKPLEPIRITREHAGDLIKWRDQLNENYKFNIIDVSDLEDIGAVIIGIESIYNRKVEII